MVTVYNLGAEASAKSVTVVAERQSGDRAEHRTVYKEGEVFKTELPVGVYRVYIDGAREDVASLVKHRIEPGATTMVDLDRNPPQVYCTAAGERVSPTGVGAFDSKGLRRPKHDEIDLLGSAKLNVVIEYCEKTSSKGETRYKSARMMSDATSIFGDNLAFNRSTGQISAFDTTVTAVQHERRATRKVGAEDVIATFKDGVPHVGFGPFSIVGNGALAGGKTTFGFNVSRSSFAFEYEDQAEGLVLVSDDDDCSFLRSLPDKTARFSGSATVTGSSDLLKGRPTPLTVNFEVRIADKGNKGRDSFSIEIFDLPYQKSLQRLTSGDIRTTKASDTTSAVPVSRVLKRKSL
jgi:hypothetical protein